MARDVEFAALRPLDGAFRRRRQYHAPDPMPRWRRSSRRRRRRSVARAVRGRDPTAQREGGSRPEGGDRRADRRRALTLRCRHVCRAVVAYEPVWAIGTGRTATPPTGPGRTFIRSKTGRGRCCNRDSPLPDRLRWRREIRQRSRAVPQPDVDGRLVSNAVTGRREVSLNLRGSAVRRDAG